MNMAETIETELDAVIQAAIKKHGNKRDAVIPIMSEIHQSLGYIPREAFGKLRREISDPGEGLFLADSHMFSTASFYHMFSLKPSGKHVVRFCENAPCHVTGGRRVIQAIQDCLGIAVGETSEDKQWTLLQTSCLGVCAVGPVFLVDQDLYGNVTPERVPRILAKYR